MWVVTGRIGGDGDSCRRQSLEFPLINLGISTASFYKCFCWQWPSNIRSMRAGCSCGSEEPSVLVSPYLEMLDSNLKVSCSLLTQQAPTWRFNCCTLEQWPLAKSDPSSIGLRQMILALPILQRISYLLQRDLSSWLIPRRRYYPGHIRKCTGSHFCGEEELFFIVKEGINHSWWRG